MHQISILPKSVAIMKIDVILVCLYLLIDTIDLQKVADTPSLTYLNITRHRRQSTKNVEGFFCTLPDYPENGRWTILNGSGKPGETISINSVLKFQCNEGYKLSSENVYVICDGNWNSPKNIRECDRLCLPMYSSSTTSLKCVDKTGKDINCHEATHGSYLTYNCSLFYETPFGYKKSLLCSHGIWNYPKPVCQPVCGKKTSDDVTPLIFGGKVNKDIIEYPWVIALYRKTNNKYINICGGSIISPRIVLTAAHCVTNGVGDNLAKELFQVAAGKLYNSYMDSRDPEPQYLEIFRIIVHPSYKGESRRFLADLAILVTHKSFVLNNFVQPVCFNDINNVHLHAGNIGTVSGWGVKEDGLPSDELRSLEIPYKYETTCAQELPVDWGNKYNMIDKICAGFLNRSMSVCKGDSGNALAVKNPDNNRYYIHGIVSIGPTDKGECNVQQNSLYTKVAFYYDYIDRETTKYFVEECLLPSYPDNGKWTVSDEDRRPGDTVPGNTILDLTCNYGYKLSSEISQIDCESSHKMPACKLVCPTLEFPPKADFNCKNKDGQKISCAEATNNATLTYTCPENYEISKGTENIRQCLNGSWGIPKPQCVEKVVTTVAPETSENTPTKVVCTYASWQSYQGVNPEDFNATLCTHVVYAFAGLWPDGKLRAQDETLDLSTHKKGLYHRVTDMKQRNENLKVLLSVGGSGASNASLYSAIAAHPQKRTAFIMSAKQVLKTYHFDGLDIEWHIPEIDDKRNYITLLREVNQALKQHGWLLTATVRSDPFSSGYDGTEMNRILDWVNVKTYDMYGDWSKYTGQNSALYPSSLEFEWEKQHLNVDASAKNWLQVGITKNKLVLSIAFFGRSFTLKDKNLNGIHSAISGAGPGGGGGFLRYSEICQNYNNWTRVWDTEQRNPYRYHENQWFGYDDKESVWIKAAYIKENGYSGVNVWPVDGDDVHGKCGMKQVLLKEVHRGLGNN